MTFKEYKRVRLKGVDLDRLLLKIYGENIHISNIKRPNHNELEFIVFDKDFFKIKRYFNNYEFTIEELGFRSYKKKLLSHLSVLVCAVIVVFCAIYCSNFIWKIDISGLEDIGQNELISLLEENGVGCGKQKFLTVSEIEKILLTNDRIAQVSCYYRGTTLMINVSEKLVYTPVEYPPIVAKFSGIITDYEVKKGTINFVVGEYVNVGDILVYPYILDKNGNKVLVEPEAKINAKIYINETTTIAEKETVFVRSGETATRYQISFRNPKEISNKIKNPFVFFETNVYNEYISSILPFVRQKIVFYELVAVEKTNDLTAIQSTIEEDCLDNALAKAEEVGNILEQNTQSVIVDGVLYTTATVVCLGSII